MPPEYINYPIKRISRAEYHRRFKERITTPIMEEEVDYTMALLFNGPDPEAVTILSQVQFGELIRGALAVYLYFANKFPYPGVILDDDTWLPDSRQTLRFTTPNGPDQPALQGYFMQAEPDTSGFTLAETAEPTNHILL